MPSDPITLGDITVTFLVEAGDSNDSMTMFEVAVAHEGRVPAPHSHDGWEETIYGLTGTLTLTVGGVEDLLGPGEAVCIPRGVVHGFEAVDGDVTFLVVSSPGVFGPAYFRAIADVIARAGDGPPDLEAIHAVMREHGLTPA